MPVDRTGPEHDQTPNASGPADGGAEFGTTQWSLVLSAGHRSSPDRHDALSVLATLDKEMTIAGKRTQFETLKGFLSGKRPPGAYTEAARLMHVSEGAVKVAAHRLRKRYCQFMRDEIAQTVADPDEVEEEIRSLFVMLGP